MQLFNSLLAKLVTRLSHFFDKKTYLSSTLTYRGVNYQTNNYQTNILKNSYSVFRVKHKKQLIYRGIPYQYKKVITIKKQTSIKKKEPFSLVSNYTLESIYEQLEVNNKQNTSYCENSIAPSELANTFSIPKPVLPIWVLNKDIYKNGSKAISRGGEGEIWKTERKEYLLKLYHKSTPERVKKLEIMVVCHPTKPHISSNYIPWAWPQYLLENPQGEVIGFVMPFISKSRKLPEIYIPRSRKKLNLELEWQVDWKFLHITAKKLANAIYSLHDKSYVIGDMKPDNIVVDKYASPSILDTDSFQVCHANEIYPCLVGSEGFTPPELLEIDLANVQQLPEHDNFRLAVIIYHLLLEIHPFTGFWKNSEEPPEIDELVRQGLWLYANEATQKMKQPGDRVIPLGIVHPELQKLFFRCFNNGHNNPNTRPTALEWVNALEVAVKDLVKCDKVSTHWYSKHYKVCYWCERKEKLKSDSFDNNKQYKKLCQLLEAQKWKEADLETKYILLKIADRMNEGWLDKSALENFPTEVITTIDRLWLNSSSGCFGFSVQKRIYLETGNKLGEINWETYNYFAELVGWREGGIWKNYLDLEFSLSAPEGHLPFCCAGFDVCVLVFLSLRLEAVD